MKKHALVLSVLAGTACTAVAANDVRISAVYGGGGNTGAPLRNDYVELYNAGSSPVDITGWSVQYAGATSTNWTPIALAGTIAPGGYYLVQLGGGANGALLPTPDATGTVNMSAVNGKVALRNNAIDLDGSACPVTDVAVSATIVDFVGWGTANCFEGTAAASQSNTTAANRLSNGCQDTDVNSADFQVAAPFPRNSTNPTFTCPTFTDCNANGIPDDTEIAGNPALDCNTDGTLDICQITPALDCDANGVLDTCDIASGGVDCNANGRLDSCEFISGELTDVNLNTIADACEGAAVAEANVNATVQPDPFGVRNPTNGTAFFNVQGPGSGPTPSTFRSYGGLRWDISAAVARFNTDFGVGGWQIKEAYLQLVQSNAGFSADGQGLINWTNQDLVDFDPSRTPEITFFDNFAIDFPDATAAAPLNYLVLSNGTKEVYKLFDLAGTNLAGGDALAAELNSATGTLTLAITPDVTNTPTVAATYAGNANNTLAGPTLILFAQAADPGCPCPFDYNNSGSDIPDIEDLLQFFDDFNNGLEAADVNCTGAGSIPDVEDLLFFFDAFNATGPCAP